MSQSTSPESNDKEVQGITRISVQGFKSLYDECSIEIRPLTATDKTVISLDDNTARTFFSQAASEINALKEIVWVNPDKVEEETPIEWLESGAKTESKRLLATWRDRVP